MPDTVFVSYARNDDMQPPFEASIHGWVTFFWHQLRFELTDAGVASATLWRDRYQIDPAERFTDKIEQALQEARIIVPILSPNWADRHWCKEELAHFCKVHGEDGIILVVKRETPKDLMPSALRDREGYRFFDRDPTGKVREFYWRGLKQESEYLAQVKQIATRIAARLLAPQAVRVPPPLPGPPRRAVFVAVLPELQDARLRLVNDLRNAGFDVLPEDGALPDDPEAARDALLPMLARAELSVHLLGAAPAPGSPPGLAQLQLRLARDRAAQPGSDHRTILWAPKWLPGAPDHKRDPFEIVRQFGGDPAGAEVFGEPVTNLSQWLRTRLAASTAATGHGAEPSIVIVAAADPADEELAAELANRLQGGPVRVLALFPGDPVPTLDPADHAAALVVWGAASRARLDDLLAALGAVAGPMAVLRLPGGDEPAKRRFFKDGVLSERLPALPADRKAARALLVDLEILHPDPAAR